MAVYHSKDELIAQVHSLSERALADGVLIDLPRSRRRQQGSDPQKRITLVLDGDLKRRMAAQIERYVERFGKGTGWDIMLRRLEQPIIEDGDEAE